MHNLRAYARHINEGVKDYKGPTLGISSNIVGCPQFVEGMQYVIISGLHCSFVNESISSLTLLELGTFLYFLGTYIGIIAVLKPDFSRIWIATTNICKLMRKFPFIRFDCTHVR